MSPFKSAPSFSTLLRSSLSASPLTLNAICKIPRQHLLFRQSILSIPHSSNPIDSDSPQMSNQSDSPAALGVESRERKRRKFEKVVDERRSRWRSDSEHRIYSTKLLHALRFVHFHDDPRNLRAAADRALAVAAKGRTRWSRAILKHRRLRSRILKKVSKKNPNKKFASSSSTASTSGGFCISRPGKSPAVEKRVRVLGLLVPGCRKLSLPNLLEETTDYISALEMQVRAMAKLAQLLSVDPV